MKKENTIKVLKIEPNKAPYEKEITNELKCLQEEVGGGLIEVVYIDNNCLLIINEEGKLNGMEPNRWLGNEEIICGPFFVCSDSGDNFAPLNQTQIAAFKKHFAEVPTFTGEEIQLEPMATVIGFDPMGGLK